eukprot:444424-Pleurochrysis_carterae.AAC.2
MRRAIAGIARAEQPMAGVDCKIRQTGGRLIHQGVPRSEETIDVVPNPNDERKCMIKAKNN